MSNHINQNHKKIAELAIAVFAMGVLSVSTGKVFADSVNLDKQYEVLELLAIDEGQVVEAQELSEKREENEHRMMASGVISLASGLGVVYTAAGMTGYIADEISSKKNNEREM